MSRAFTKDRDDAPEPVIASHTPGVPVPLTPAGHAKLEQRLRGAQTAAERKRLENLMADAVIAEPPADRSVAAFGATVAVHGAEIGSRRYTIVGADEADIPAGRVSSVSPLGSALLGSRAGDSVIWHRPVGDIELTVESVAYDGPDASAESESS